PGALVSPPSVSPSMGSVPVEEAGRYQVVIEGSSDGTYQLAVQGFSDGTQVFVQALEGEIKRGVRFRGSVLVQMQGGKLAAGSLQPFVLERTGEGPGKFTRTQNAVAGAALTATAVVEAG